MNFPFTSAARGGADADDEDELEGFDDFTIASSWEKVIASIEATARDWQTAGPAGLLAAGAVPVVGSRRLHHVHKEIFFGKKPYVVIFFFHVGSDTEIRDEWPIGLHHLQLWFGVKDFVVVVPVTSGVILDAPEATTLLSTVAIALSSCGSDWPAFVPVIDPARKAYKGVQGTNTSYSITFEADRISTWVPVRFMHLEGLYELFVSKVAFTVTSSAAVPALKVEFTMRLTYRTPVFGTKYQNQGVSPAADAIADHDLEELNEPPWDEDLPWGEWHSVEDPIQGFELVAIWNSRFVNSPWEMAEYENASTFDADKWSLIPVFTEKREDNKEEGFAGRLEALIKAFYVAGEAQFMDEFSNVVKPEMDLLLETFTVPPPSVLDRVVRDLFYAAVIPRGDGFSYTRSGTFIKGAPRDSLFGRFSLQALRFGTCNIRAISELWLEFVREIRWCWDECQPLPRVSPEEPPDLSTCLLHQKLQLLAGCIKLKEEEVAQGKPVSDHSVPKDGPHRKATSSDRGVNRKDATESKPVPPKVSKGRSEIESQSSEVFQDSLPTFSSESSEDEMESLFRPPTQEDEMESLFRPPTQKDEIDSLSSHEQHLQKKAFEQRRMSISGSATGSAPLNEALHASDDEEPWEPLEAARVHENPAREGRRGSTGPFEDLMLLNVQEHLHVPAVQRTPMMTEDMLLEREQAIAALNRSPSEKVASIRLQTDFLASDIAAFKAANPGAVFEDFVRWHSPKDWVEENLSGDEEISGSARRGEGIESTWPPQGKLSNRMSQPGNMYSQIWDRIAAEPASEQKPLFDYKREGEKVMHYLDTLRPQQLLAQMVCTAFMVSVEALKRSVNGEVLERLHSEVRELYSSMDLILEPLSSLSKADVPSKELVDSWKEDLLRLCAVFGKVEKEVFVAASLFQKLKMTPVVLDSLFSSFLDDGERLTSARIQNTSSDSWEGSTKEMDLVAELFPAESTGQSARKTQRMGNYLNGNEPDVREVKFQCYEEDLSKRWNSRKEKRAPRKTFSHRMYACGTSNDLQVALSVVSRD